MRPLHALTTAALLALGMAAPATANERLGIWTTTDRNMEYVVELCGDGTQLCGRLVALHGPANSAEGRAFLNLPIVDQLVQVSPNVWQGTVHHQGQSASGTVTLQPDRSIVVNGCMYFILCRSYTLIPKS